MSAPEYFSSILEERFISLATSRRNGEEVRTAVWFAEADGCLYLRTIAGSGKLKRIKNDPRVRIAPCDIAGEISGAWLDAQARALETDDPAVLVADRALDAKYGGERREVTRLMAEQRKQLQFVELRSALPE